MGILKSLMLLRYLLITIIAIGVPWTAEYMNTLGR